MKREEWIAKRRRLVRKKDCPICNLKMQNKGSFSRKYWRCTKCGLKILKDGTIIQPTDDALTKITEVTTRRNELYTRRMVKRLKRKKYLGYTNFIHNGQLINLDDWDKSGLMKEEIEDINKRYKEMQTKKKLKKAKKNVVNLDAEPDIGVQPEGREKTVASV